MKNKICTLSQESEQFCQEDFFSTRRVLKKSAFPVEINLVLSSHTINLFNFAYSTTMDRLLRLSSGLGGMGQGAPSSDGPVVDTAEQVYISSLALLKMLKHGRAGVPMEVMGLMLGEFVDDYTVRVIDVFAMPQSGTVSRKDIVHQIIHSSTDKN